MASWPARLGAHGRGAVLWVVSLVVCGLVAATFLINQTEDVPTARGPVRGGPIMFQPVVDVMDAPCPAGSAVVPDVAAEECFTLAAGLTVHEVESISVRTDPYQEGAYVLGIELNARDDAAFADLTRRLAVAADQGRRLAVVHAGRVWTSPRVGSPITDGWVRLGISGQEADHVIAQVIGGS